MSLVNLFGFISLLLGFHICRNSFCIWLTLQLLRSLEVQCSQYLVLYRTLTEGVPKY